MAVSAAHRLILFTQLDIAEILPTQLRVYNRLAKYLLLSFGSAHQLNLDVLVLLFVYVFTFGHQLSVGVHLLIEVLLYYLARWLAKEVLFISDFIHRLYRVVLVQMENVLGPGVRSLICWRDNLVKVLVFALELRLGSLK
jgi:hypothetical protein